jgi:hypothetical protein
VLPVPASDVFHTHKTKACTDDFGCNVDNILRSCGELPNKWHLFDHRVLEVDLSLSFEKGKQAKENDCEKKSRGEAIWALGVSLMRVERVAFHVFFLHFICDFYSDSD